MTGPFKMKGFSGFKSSPAKVKDAHHPWALIGVPRTKKSAPVKATDPTHSESGKRIMSLSDEQTQKDNKNLENAANRNKAGGIGDATIEEQKTTEKSRKRQAVIDAQGKSRKELKKAAKGTKFKKFFTSTKNLKSEVTTKAIKDAKGTQGQVLQHDDVKDKDKYSGVKE